MSYCLYLTADQIGMESGGGKVTYHEMEAMKKLIGFKLIDEVIPVSIDRENPLNPFEQDENILSKVKQIVESKKQYPILAHGYAGCLSKTIKYLKSFGTKLTYTAAAHSVQESKEEHEKLGFSFQYPHLTDPGLWREYLNGYADVDVLITPSMYSARVMDSYFSKHDKILHKIKVVQHGINPILHSVEPLPKQFIIGYLGAIGPDKGLIYLLQAWKELNWNDAILYLGGKDSNSQYMHYLLHLYGGGIVSLFGWIPEIKTFYDSISCYVQPSVTEGFGIEVLESLSHGRPVICSTGAGAVDLVSPIYQVSPRNVGELIDRIKMVRKFMEDSFFVPQQLESLQFAAKEYEWLKIYDKYLKIWGELIQ